MEFQQMLLVFSRTMVFSHLRSDRGNRGCLGHQGPKLEQYGNSLFVVLRTAHLAGESQHVEFAETHVFVGPRYVVSVRHGSLQSHVGLRARCEASRHLLAKGPGFVLYALMDFVVDQYFPILEALEEKVVELEEVVLDEKFIEQTTSRIYHLKRELLSIKRAVSPLVDISSRLMRFDLELIPEDTKPYFRDVYDHAMRINEMADTLRELCHRAECKSLGYLGVAEQGHQTFSGMGCNHRCTYGDRWHLRHELKHA
jgi:magnesium transporter